MILIAFLLVLAFGLGVVYGISLADKYPLTPLRSRCRWRFTKPHAPWRGGHA
jgi:hypothetical protein